MNNLFSKVIVLALVLLFSLTLIFSASVTHAQVASNIVPCGNPGQAECQTNDFFKLVQNIVNYFTFVLAVPVATVAIAYAGIGMASQPAKPEKRKQAIEILQAAIIGLALVLAAWLIVNTIFNYLAKDTLKSSVHSFLPQ